VTGRGVTFILVGLTIAAAVAIAVVAAGDENGPEPPAAGTAVSCDRIADPGDDLAEFLSALSTGETGCLSEGEHLAPDGELKIESPEITLASAPGTMAKLVGRVWIAPEADGVRIQGLELDGRNDRDLPSPTISASGVVLLGNDISNGQSATCVSIGGGPGRSSGTIIEGNLIHDCGLLPPTNHHHGIYVADATDTVIRGNWIYDNADRGIQLYPNADDTVITGNVIDDNGEGIIFGGNDSEVSERNLVEGNVITNSEVRYNVESSWPGNVGGGNLVRGNCVFGGTRNPEGGGIKDPTEGFVAEENLIADPEYVDRGAADYALPADSPCRDLLGRNR